MSTERRPLVIAVAAMASNRVIGLAGRIPWHLPEDLKHFQALTRGHPIIMGRKTFESLPKPLPQRTNIVVSRRLGLVVPAGVESVSDPESALAVAQRAPGGEDRIFVVGGAEIYRALLARTDRIELTLIERSYDGDAYFPPFESEAFRLVGERVGVGALPHRYLTYDRSKDA